MIQQYLCLLNYGWDGLLLEFMGIKDFIVCFSSSLDDLEVDGGSGGVSDRSHIHYPPLGSSEAMTCSRDGLDLSTSLQPKVFDTILVCIVFLLSKSLKTCEKHLNLKGKNEFPVGHASPSGEQHPQRCGGAGVPQLWPGLAEAMGRVHQRFDSALKKASFIRSVSKEISWVQ